MDLPRFLPTSERSEEGARLHANARQIGIERAAEWCAATDGDRGVLDSQDAQAGIPGPTAFAVRLATGPRAPRRSRRRGRYSASSRQEPPPHRRDPRRPRCPRLRGAGRSGRTRDHRTVAASNPDPAFGLGAREHHRRDAVDDGRSRPRASIFEPLGDVNQGCLVDE